MTAKENHPSGNSGAGAEQPNLNRRSLLAGAATLGVGGAVLTSSVIAGANGARAASGEPIPIGSMLPLTGGAASDGLSGKAGVELAIEEINAMGGILGRPLEAHFADTKNMSAEEAVSAANMLIDREGVHAIHCCYNIGPNNAEYEPIADAGIIYSHVNTSIQHQNTVMSNPERYFGCFMSCPPETYYGANLPFMLGQLRDSGAWKPQNNKIALVVGSLPYSMVIADQIKQNAGKHGFEVVFEEVVPVPTTEWGVVLDKIRPLNPACIANTHFFSGDLANFQRQFVSKPTNSLVYLQYGALLQSFSDVAREAAVGVMTSTMIGVLPDERGKAFAKKIADKFGPTVNIDPAAYTYGELMHYAIAATLAGGTGEPGNFDQNRKVAAQMKSIVYRGVCGSVAYRPEWQCAQPYPAFQKDPSLGIPCLTFQIKEASGAKELIYPAPYTSGSFITPSWFT